jgi:hypothetical protein
VPESKTVKNRLHLDIHASGGRAIPIATRRERVNAEARRLTDLGATTIRVLEEEGIDHYGIAMKEAEETGSTSTDRHAAGPAPNDAGPRPGSRAA